MLRLRSTYAPLTLRLRSTYAPLTLHLRFTYASFTLHLRYPLTLRSLSAKVRYASLLYRFALTVYLPNCYAHIIKISAARPLPSRITQHSAWRTLGMCLVPRSALRDGQRWNSRGGKPNLSLSSLLVHKQITVQPQSEWRHDSVFPAPPSKDCCRKTDFQRDIDFNRHCVWKGLVDQHGSWKQSSTDQSFRFPLIWPIYVHISFYSTVDCIRIRINFSAHKSWFQIFHMKLFQSRYS